MTPIATRRYLGYWVLPTLLAGCADPTGPIDIAQECERAGGVWRGSHCERAAGAGY